MPTEVVATSAPEMGSQNDAQTSPPMMMGAARQASPEEQQEYDKLVAQSFNLIYDPRTFPGILEMLKGEGDPVEGLARTASMVVLRVLSSAQQAGVEFTPDVKLHAGAEVLEDLAELSRQSGVHDYTQDPDGLEGAFFKALDIVRTTLQEAGQTDPQAAARDMAMLEDMDRSGELEKVLRGLAGGGEEAPNEPMPKRGLMSAAGRA